MSTENENGVVNAGKRFKNSIVEKLKKDVENLKYSTNYSQSNLFRLQVTDKLFLSNSKSFKNKIKI